MSMQMDAEFKKEQNGTLFVWMGALEGGFGEWVVPQRCPPQNEPIFSLNLQNHPKVLLMLFRRTRPKCHPDIPGQTCQCAC
jgi:hypothetical protein